MIMLKRCLAILLIFPVFCAHGEMTQARQDEILHLLKQDCGSCHGMTLKGGLGPALTAKALRDKPSEYLEIVILSGRPGTPMPPWRRFLNEQEVHWLVGRLKSGDINDENN